MQIFNPKEIHFLRKVADLADCNPFFQERIEAEKAVLGKEFRSSGQVWAVCPDNWEDTPNNLAIARMTEEKVHEFKKRLENARASREELQLYRRLVEYHVYYQFEQSFFQLILESEKNLSEKNTPIPFYKGFVEAVEDLTDVDGLRNTITAEAIGHLFACCYQVRRAFHYIFRFLVGTSKESSELRGAIWQSIFTHDFQRYRRALYNRMRDFSLLITGPSGSGKELTARAVAFSGYIPFNSQTACFFAKPGACFFPLNLSAMSPMLIESELFGYRRGAFTGADSDHAGWLEVCGPFGSVFLDEIGDISLELQVKLLRVLETGCFQRIGETRQRMFEGKIIAATNRDLSAGIRDGQFRADLYYRLCSDRIRTPSLNEQILEDVNELRTFVQFICNRIVGEEESRELCEEVIRWIPEHLGMSYAWPGNVRELMQCIRNVLIRKDYTPAESAGFASDEFFDKITSCSLTADELMNRYCSMVYEKTGSYREAADRLQLDVRTAKKKIDFDPPED